MHAYPAPEITCVFTVNEIFQICWSAHIALVLKHFHGFPSHLAPALSSWPWPRITRLLWPPLSLSDFLCCWFTLCLLCAPLTSLLTAPWPCWASFFGVFAFDLHLAWCSFPRLTDVLSVSCESHSPPLSALSVLLDGFWQVTSPPLPIGFQLGLVSERHPFLCGEEKERSRERILEVSSLFSLFGYYLQKSLHLCHGPSICKVAGPLGLFSLFFSPKVNCESLGCLVVTCLLLKHFEHHHN